MTVALWVVQGLLAIAFLLVGSVHTFQPIGQLARSIPWARAVPRPFLRFIGVSELLGAVGLVLPMLTGILPQLTVAAAGGLAVVMLSAIIFHAARREYRNILGNVVLLILAAVVISGRLTVAPA
jgi:uncharacterized membrane protein